MLQTENNVAVCFNKLYLYSKIILVRSHNIINFTHGSTEYPNTQLFVMSVKCPVLRTMLNKKIKEAGYSKTATSLKFVCSNGQGPVALSMVSTSHQGCH